MKALLVAEVLSFDPELFCSACIPEVAPKGRHRVVIRLKDGTDHTVGFTSHKDAAEWLAGFTDRVNEAVSAGQFVGSPIGESPEVKDLIKKTAEVTVDTFWNRPFPGSQQPLDVSESKPVTVDPSVYWPASFGSTARSSEVPGIDADDAHEVRHYPSE